MAFQYRMEEVRAGQHVTSASPEVKSSDLLERRGELFLWAFLVSEAVQQVSEQCARVESRFSKLIANAAEYWRDDVEKLEETRLEWSPLLVEMVRTTSITLVPKSAYHAAPDVPRIHIRLGDREVEVRGERLSFVRRLRNVRHIEDVKAQAKVIVREAIEALEPFQGSVPELPAE